MSSPAVMLIDDDDDIRTTVVDILETAGHAVMAAAHGREALDTLRAGARPAVILLDMMMPEMDGRAFLAQLAADPELASIPVVVFTAYGRPRDLEQPIAGFLRKPLRLRELLAAVERWLPTPPGLQSPS